MLTIYIVARRDSILGKTTNQNGRNSISPGETRHISYLNGGGAVAATNIRCNNTKNSKHKTRKSPLERAKSIIKQHGERTGTGRVVKPKSKRKVRKACDGGITHQRVTNETRLVIQSIPSPNVKEFNVRTSMLTFTAEGKITAIVEQAKKDDSKTLLTKIEDYFTKESKFCNDLLDGF